MELEEVGLWPRAGEESWGGLDGEEAWPALGCIQRVSFFRPSILSFLSFFVDGDEG